MCTADGSQCEVRTLSFVFMQREILVACGWEESQHERVVVGLYLFNVVHISVV